MGALDVNGIYKYAETDLASTFSTLLNTGQTSVSNALAAIKTSTNSRLTALESNDTGWVAVTAASGFTTDMKVRRIGKVVYVAGLITTSAAQTISSTPLTIGTIPTGFVIGATEYLWPATSTLATPLTALITNGGALQIRSFLNGGVTAPAGVSFGIASGWVTA